MAKRTVLAANNAALEHISRLQRLDQHIISRAGYGVDTSGSTWLIPHPGRSVVLKWEEVSIDSEIVRYATEAYFRYLIQNYSVREVSNNWGLLKHVWPLSTLKTSEEIPIHFFTELEDALSRHSKYRLHFARKWYVWCSEAGFAPFSPEVAFHLEQRVIGGNEKGSAVRSVHPDAGPLQDSEVAALTNALRGGRMRSVLTLQEEVAVWMALAFGSNPEPMALLREQDFFTLPDPDAEHNTPIYLINIPRHKKGDAGPRMQFRERRVSSEIGELIQALIAQNRTISPPRNADDDGRPLFRRHSARDDLPQEGTGSDYRFHYSSQEFAALVSSTVSKLAVISPRTGGPLKATTRRFRYTFATRLVKEGASPRVVAQLLDHTDLQNVGVYFDSKSDIVTRLDAAAALELGPLAQAFLGKLVRSEQDAVRGDRPSSRIYHTDTKQEALDALGTCGSFSFCGLTAPIACYTCVRFQPWIDAPHDRALSSLLVERSRRLDAGLAPSIVEMFDMTILAIADVIRRIDVVRTGGTSVG